MNKTVMIKVQQTESLGFTKQSSEYKGTFIQIILALREGENTVGGAELHGEKLNRRK